MHSFLNPLLPELIMKTIVYHWHRTVSPKILTFMIIYVHIFLVALSKRTNLKMQ